MISLSSNIKRGHSIHLAIKLLYRTKLTQVK